MRFHHLDLNLLVALDVLLDEQNITRAAERLHMTQSATSGVLGRLRSFFEDELLVQVGRRMQPTPYALELASPVREVLMTIRSSITAFSRLHPPATTAASSAEARAGDGWVIGWAPPVACMAAKRARAEGFGPSVIIGATPRSITSIKTMSGEKRAMRSGRQAPS